MSNETRWTTIVLLVVFGSAKARVLNILINPCCVPPHMVTE